MKPVTTIAANKPAVFKILTEEHFVRRMSYLQELIAQRAYQLFASHGFEHGHDLDDWLQAEAQLMKTIPLELEETPDAVKIKALLHGYCAKDIEIHLEPHRMFLSGCREQKSKPEKGTITYADNSGRVFRCMDLTAQIDPSRIEAKLSNGELQIELPKARAENQVALAAKAA